VCNIQWIKMYGETITFVIISLIPISPSQQRSIVQKQYSILYRLPTVHKCRKKKYTCTSLMPLNGPHFVSLTKNKWYHCIVLCLRDTLRSNGWPDYIYSQYRWLPSESGRMNRRKKFFSSQQLRPKTPIYYTSLSFLHNGYRELFNTVQGNGRMKLALISMSCQS